MQTSLYTLSSSELLNLRGTPIEVIPAQGSGFYITPLIVTLRSHYGSATYGNLTAALALTINGTNIFSNTMSTSLLGNAYDSFVTYSFANSNVLRVSDCDNKGIYIKNTGLLDLSSGNGTLDVQIVFEINNV